MLDAMALARCRDYSEWYSLPAHMQELWFAHAKNNWTGAYNSNGAPRSRGSAGVDHAAERRAILERGEGRP